MSEDSEVIFTLQAPSFASELTVKMVKGLTLLEEEQLRQISTRARSDIPDRYQCVKQKVIEISAITDSSILGFTVCSACGYPLSGIREGPLSRSLFGNVTSGSVTAGVFCHREECPFYLKFIPVNKATELSNVAFYPQITLATENFLKEHPEFRKNELMPIIQSPLAIEDHPQTSTKQEWASKSIKYDESIEKWFEERNDEELSQLYNLFKLIKDEQTKWDLLLAAFRWTVNECSELSNLKHLYHISDLDTLDDTLLMLRNISSAQMEHILNRRKSGVCIRCKKPFLGIIKESDKKRYLNVYPADYLFISIHDYTGMCTDCIGEFLLDIINKLDSDSSDS